MAQALLARGLRGDTTGDTDSSIAVASAGTAAVTGSPAHPAALTVLGAAAAELEGFRARQLLRAMVLGSALVLVATREHLRAVEVLAPGSAGWTYTMSEAGRLSARLARTDIAADRERLREVTSALSRERARRQLPPGSWMDVADPYGRDEHVFAVTHAAIRAAIEPLVAVMRPG